MIGQGSDISLEKVCDDLWIGPGRMCCNTRKYLGFDFVVTVSLSDITHHQRDTPIPADLLSNRPSAKGNIVWLLRELIKKKVKINELETMVRWIDNIKS